MIRPLQEPEMVRTADVEAVLREVATQLLHRCDLMKSWPANVPKLSVLNEARGYEELLLSVMSATGLAVAS